MTGPFNGAERRRGLHELAEKIDCLSSQFNETRAEVQEQYRNLAADIKAQAEWRLAEAQPALDKLDTLDDDLRDIKTTARVVATVITLLVGVVTWVFLTTYELLKDTAKLTNDNARVIAAIAERLDAEKRRNDYQDSLIGK